MDIHKPKPWHGLREFLKEFGTIVLGVLVALGAEQAVEWSHHQSEVREARAALRTEVADDMMRALRNQRREGCDQLYSQRFVAWAEGGPIPPIPSNPYLFLSSANWDTVKSGPVAFMPLKEKLAFAHFYAGVADYNDMAVRERSAALRLSEHFNLKRMDPDDAKSVLQAVSGLVTTESVLIGSASGVQQAGAAAGVNAAPIPPEVTARLDAFCHQAGPAPRGG